MKRRVFILFLAVCTTVNTLAQTSRGVMATPDFSYNPAEGVYDTPSSDRFLLYTFGVSKTVANAFRPLRFPDEDCRKVEECIKDVFKYSYEVRVARLDTLEYYQNKKDILRQLDEALSSARSGDIVMLYFSGHGIVASNPYVASEYYFIPYDIVKENPQASAVSGAEIRQYIDAISRKGALVLVFVDTCHSEAIYPGKSTNGDGRVAYFASSEAGGTTVENAIIGSTPFTNALVELFTNESNLEDLKVGDIGEILGANAAGGVPPRLLNSKDYILLHSFDKKTRYHHTLDKYKYYVDLGRTSAQQKDYFRAFFEFYEARSLERVLDKRDRIDYSTVISALNQELASDIESAAGDFSNPIWESLSLIDENTYFIDTELVPLRLLFSECGSYFFEKKDYPRSYEFFKKGFSFGDNAKSAYYIAKIAELHLPGKLSKKEVEDYYATARRNGYEGDNVVKARAELIKGAEAGDVNCQAILGRCYYIGDTLGFKRDGEKAIRWLKLASNKNHLDGMRWLGHCYRDGFGVGEDQEMATRLYKTSYSKGSKMSGCYYAIQLLEGKGIKQNKRKGFSLLKSFADEGIDVAQFQYGWNLCWGNLIKHDKEKGLEYLTRAASQGYVVAQAALGQIYAFSDNIADREKAFYWISKSIEKNSSDGLRILGQMYFRGDYLAQNDSLGLHYIHLSAQQNDFAAEYILGYVYQYGKRVTRDLEKALYWYKKAIADGDEWDSPEQLNVLYIDLGQYYLGWDEDSVIDYDKAYEFLSLADKCIYDDEDYIRLQRMLGRCYHRGLGVNVNFDEALRRYQLAADKGSVGALNDMGLVYFEGDESHRDFDKAYDCFKRVSDSGDAYGMLNLGRLYKEKGDIQQALNYLKQASNAGDIYATELLGDYYYDGFGSGQFVDTDLAIPYFERVLEKYPNYSSIKLRLGICYYNHAIACEERADYSQTYAFAQKAIDMGYLDSWLVVGNLYHYGHYFEKNEKEGLRCYIKAYELGNDNEDLLKLMPEVYSRLFSLLYNEKQYPEAFNVALSSVEHGNYAELFWVGYMFDRGLGVEKNTERAITYYEKAISSGTEIKLSKKYLSSAYYTLFCDSYNAMDYQRALIYCEKAIEYGNEKAKKYLKYVRVKAGC